MKKLQIVFGLFLILISRQVFGQDTIYYDSEMNKLSTKSGASFYQILEYDNNDSDKVAVKSYFKSGKIKEIKNYSSYSKNKLDGKDKEWFENGQLKHENDYKDGKYDGQVLTYWKNGQLRRNDNYKDGEFIDGICYNSKGIKIKHFEYEVSAQFPGGIDSLKKYVLNKVIFPEQARENGIQGRVYVSLIVEKDGKINNIKVVRNVFPALDEEAIRVIKSMPKWIPEKIDGEAVRVPITIPIHFHLN